MTYTEDTSKNPLSAAWESEEKSGGQEGGEAFSYLSRLTKQRLLTPDEERELARRIKSGDRRAKDTLVEANMRLVINFAKNYRSSRVPMEDLIQEGALGLIKAAENFDPDMGYRFSTYATAWIKQSVWRAMDSKSKSIRLPVHISEAVRKLERMRSEIQRLTGEDPSVEMLAEHLGTTPRKITALMQAAQEPISLDTLVGNDDDTTLMALLEDKNTVDPEAKALKDEMYAQLDALLSILTPREQEIMRMRMGFEGDASHVLQQIGETLHLSRERVRQIEVQALRKLKFHAKRNNFFSYINS